MVTSLNPTSRREMVRGSSNNYWESYSFQLEYKSITFLKSINYEVKLNPPFRQLTERNEGGDNLIFSPLQ